MNSPTVLSAGAAQALVSSLFQELWIGIFLTLIIFLSFRAIKSPQLRYLLACVTLFLQPFLVLWFFIDGYNSASNLLLNLPSSAPMASEFFLRSAIIEAKRSPLVINTVLLFWSLGICFMSIRLLGGWTMVMKKIVKRSEPLASDWQERMRSWVQKLGISPRVRLAGSQHIDSPLVFGWVRPVVLFPLATINGMSVENLEALLVHELIHIRRHDYLINLLQSVVEVLLFFHPAIWWMSSRIREEREYCCDDEVVVQLKNPIGYARFLAELESVRAQSLHVAATGGSLMKRIKRILFPHKQDQIKSRWFAPTLLFVGFTTVLVFVFACDTKEISAAERSARAQAFDSWSQQLLNDQAQKPLSELNREIEEIARTKNEEDRSVEYYRLLSNICMACASELEKHLAPLYDATAEEKPKLITQGLTKVIQECRYGVHPENLKAIVYAIIQPYQIGGGGQLAR